MSNHTILLVEDNPDDVELTLRAFKKSRISNDVVVARDGEEALTYLFNRENQLPQVVLLDLNLPKINGLQVLERLRNHEHTQWLPVVILTSSKEDRDLVESYRLGVNSYIRKPVDFDQFTEAVHTIGLFWLVLNHKAPTQ